MAYVRMFENSELAVQGRGETERHVEVDREAIYVDGSEVLGVTESGGFVCLYTGAWSWWVRSERITPAMRAIPYEGWA
jgi:hypothetical protein